MLKVLLLIFITACGKTNNSSSIKGIIGESNLIPVEETLDNRVLVRSIGKMNMGCTVTHIGRGLALTAGHCFIKHSTNSLVVNKKCDYEYFDIHWGVTANSSESSLASTCEKILALESNGTVDYALIQVSPAPEDFIPISQISVNKGDKIRVVSYPKGRNLEASEECEVDRFFVNSQDKQIGYRCDTEDGSSGAPVLNQNQEIIGVHNFHNKSLQLNGATLLAKTHIMSLISLPI